MVKFLSWRDSEGIRSHRRRGLDGFKERFTSSFGLIEVADAVRRDTFVSLDSSENIEVTSARHFDMLRQNSIHCYKMPSIVE
jgi:hypothetical protein